MYALTFGSILVLLYHIISRLVFYWIILLYYIIISRLYIIIYIGHIADCLNPSLSAGIGIGYYRLSAGTTPSACQPIGCFICCLHILSVAGSNWLAHPHLINLWTCTGVKQISQASVCFSHQQPGGGASRPPLRRCCISPERRRRRWPEPSRRRTSSSVVVCRSSLLRWVRVVILFVLVSLESPTELCSAGNLVVQCHGRRWCRDDIIISFLLVFLY